MTFPHSTAVRRRARRGPPRPRSGAGRGAELRPARADRGGQERRPLVFYTANFTEVEQEVIKAFNKRFPFVKVEMVRAPGGQLITRIKTEAAAGKLSPTWSTIPTAA